MMYVSVILHQLVVGGGVAKGIRTFVDVGGDEGRRVKRFRAARTG